MSDVVASPMLGMYGSDNTASLDLGWTRVDDEGKYHFFPEEGSSLCGKVDPPGPGPFNPNTGNASVEEAGPNDCLSCMRALAARESTA